MIVFTIRNLLVLDSVHNKIKIFKYLLVAYEFIVKSKDSFKKNRI